MWHRSHRKVWRHDEWNVLPMSCSPIAEEEEKEVELGGPSCCLGM